VNKANKSRFKAGLEITRIASQFAMSVAMNLRFCIAVGGDAKLLKLQMVSFPFYLFESSQVFNGLSHSRERIFCQSVTIPISHRYTVGPYQTLRQRGQPLPGLQ
jgi:hypothetical protein